MTDPQLLVSYITRRVFRFVFTAVAAIFTIEPSPSPPHPHHHQHTTTTTITPSFTLAVYTCTYTCMRGR